MLLSGVALTDLLVGAVSMPLTITLDALVIQRILIVDIVCTVHFISASVMYSICGASILHLLLIVWVRYVAAEKRMEYKSIGTNDHINKYTRIAWLSAVLMVVPLVILVATNVRYKIILVVNVIFSIFWFVCVSLIAYFYVKTYLAVRKWNRTRIRPVNVLAQRKLESKVAYMTFWLTVFVGNSSVPLPVIYFFQGASPFFPPNFRSTLGRNNTSVKLSVQPIIVLV